MKYSFPENFLWGSAVWATGVESAAFTDGKAPTVWDEYYRIDRNRFYDDIGPDDTLDFYHRYDEFAQKAKDIGHNSFRTSISWARLLPDGKNVNEKAVRFYRSQFKAFKDRGMFLNVVLYWFDMPLMFEQKGGFSNDEVVEDFIYYCSKCFMLFDEYVDGWFIFNEPIMDIMFKYQMKVCYPCETNISKYFSCIKNMCIAHAKTVKHYRENYHHRIGCVLNQSIVYPRSESEGDLYAKKMFETIMFRCFEYPLIKGYFDEEWLNFAREKGFEIEVSEEEKKLLKENTISYLGINVYMPTRVKEQTDRNVPDALSYINSPYYAHYVWPQRKFNADRGWEIYPEVMYDLLIRNRDEYGNIEMIITENGMGIHNEERFRENGIINDSYRIEFIRDHLIYTNKAIKEGANLIGYNLWSFVDLWSPTSQFKNGYGLYEFNHDTKEIKKKKSADWYRQVCMNNGFTVEEENQNMKFEPGFDIRPLYDPLGFEYGEGCFGPVVENRTLDAIRKSLIDPECDGPEVVYSIAMDVGNEKDRQAMLERDLLFGAVTYAKGKLGKEPVRSQGHIHAVSPSCGSSTCEVYEIWTGSAYIYMQESAKDNPGRCFAVLAKAGDVVIVPPNWAHATIVADINESMTFGAWCVRDYGFDYVDVRAHKGVAWFPVVKEDDTIQFVPNENYLKSELIIKTPREYTEFNIEKGKPIYQQFEEDPDRFLFVSKPATVEDKWFNFIP